jgi:hypothetical protein
MVEMRRDPQAKVLVVRLGSLERRPGMEEQRGKTGSFQGRGGFRRELLNMAAVEGFKVHGARSISALW